MADNREARKKITQHFVDNWMVNSAPRTPIAFDNLKFDLPKETDSWVRIAVRHGAAGLAAAGSQEHRKFYKQGIVIVSLFTPKLAGMKEADEKASDIVDIFEGEGIDEPQICFENVRVQETFNEEDSWNQINIIVEFIYYDRK